MAWDWDKLQQQKKGGGVGHSPQVGEVLNKLRGTKGKFPGVWIVVAAFIVLYFGSSLFFTVGVDEVGVIQRFGRYVRVMPPGLHFKLPTGIEKVTKVKVRYVYKEEFGLRTLEAGIQTRYAPSGANSMGESLMLTGDLNVALVPWIVQFRIKDPFDYLFKVNNIRATLRDLSEAAMRLVVGDRSIDEVINKREEIALEALEVLQKELDKAETGIHVTTIELKRTNVPDTVQPSWNEVNQALQDKEKMIYQAREAYNKLIPSAKGNAEKTIKSAEGYALDRVNRAKGDAVRFIALYEEYAKAQDVTRRRLYLEAIRDIFPRLGKKFIVDEGQKNFLPLLNLGQSAGEKP